MNYLLTTFIAILVLSITSLTGCSGGSDTAGGTISDVDLEIAGRVVTGTGAAAAEAVIRIFPAGDSGVAPIDSTVSDSRGSYIFDTIPPGVYNITASSIDGSAARFGIAHTEGGTDAGIDTLRAPAAIAGTIVPASETSPLGIIVFIPGTSFAAYTDSTGSFLISGVPVTAGCAIAVNLYGYAPVTISDIPLTEGKTTSLQPIILTPNLYPAGVTAALSSPRRVAISWNRAIRSDVAGYLVYRSDTSNGAQDPVRINTGSLVTDTFFSDTLPDELFSKSDTIVFSYQVCYKTKKNDISPYSEPALIQATIVRDPSTRRTIDILFPRNPDTIASNTGTTISWIYTGVIDTVTIAFSQNGGATWYTIAPKWVNHGTYRWTTIPNISSDSCRIRVSSIHDSTAYDISDYFSIRAVPTGNMLTNSDFTLGLANWHLEVFKPAVGTVSADDGVCTIVMDSVGDAAWKLQFYQSGIQMRMGKSYRISFDARADTAQSIVIGTGMLDTPWTSYTVRDLDLSTSMTHYSFNTYMPAADDLNACLSLALGRNRGRLQFDNFEIVEETGAAAP